MIFIIGLNHEYQLEGYSEAWNSFHGFLYHKAEELNADLLAEEMSEDGIAFFKAKDSVVRRVAREQARRHLFVDPDLQKREQLGIKGYKEIIRDFGYGRVLKPDESDRVDQIERKHWERRERYWLDQLRSIEFKICILVIGTDHVQRFCLLLDKEQMKFSVLESKYQA